MNRIRTWLIFYSYSRFSDDYVYTKQKYRVIYTLVKFLSTGFPEIYQWWVKMWLRRREKFSHLTIYK